MELLEENKASESSINPFKMLHQYLLKYKLIIPKEEAIEIIEAINKSHYGNKESRRFKFLCYKQLIEMYPNKCVKTVISTIKENKPNANLIIRSLKYASLNLSEKVYSKLLKALAKDYNNLPVIRDLILYERIPTLDKESINKLVILIITHLSTIEDTMNIIICLQVILALKKSHKNLLSHNTLRSINNSIKSPVGPVISYYLSKILT